MRYAAAAIRRTGFILLLLAVPQSAPAQETSLAEWRAADLVDAVASLGVAVHGGALYVYGGHVGRVHAHSIENISPGFRRLVLQPGRTWEELARGGHLKVIDVVPATAPSDAQGAARWPGFRGGMDTNVSRAARLPVTWSDESVAWRAQTPGFGRSSPVIWDGTVFLTSIEGALKETLWVSAVSLEDGSERWRRSFAASEQLEWNDYVSKDAPTPAVDGERVYAFFASGDLLAVTHDGDTVWRRDLSGDYGSVAGNHGVGNSLLLTDSAVVVLLTRRTYSYLLAVAPATGDTLWKADREPGVAWSTPVLAPDGGEIVVSAAGRIEGFDPATGSVRWSFADFRGNHVPSPMVTDDLIYVGGMAVEAKLALRRGRTGKLDASDVAWTAGSGSNFASPFAYRDCVYWVNPAGVARCLAPDTGSEQWVHRLPASIWATPLGQGDLVYYFTEKGITQVLRATAEAPEVVATNYLSVDAPVTGFAAVDDAIVIRAGRDVIRGGTRRTETDRWQGRKERPRQCRRADSKLETGVPAQRFHPPCGDARMSSGSASCAAGHPQEI